MRMCQKDFLYLKAFFMNKIPKPDLFRVGTTTGIYKPSTPLGCIEYIGVFRKWIKRKCL